MKTTTHMMLCVLLALLLAPAVLLSQEVPAPERGMIEFGFRGVTGEIQPDRRLPSGANVPFSNGFSPDLLNSGLNSYSDFRNGFIVPRSNVVVNDFLGTKSYFSLQSASNGFGFEGGRTMSRDQSFLVTLGHEGLYKFQFRWDETPHIFSGTTRTLFTGGGSTYYVNPTVQNKLFGITKSTTLASTTCATLYPTINGSATYNYPTCLAQAMSDATAGTGPFAGTGGAYPFAQEESRKTATVLAGWRITPNWNTFFQFSRENQFGTRPLGMVFGSGSTSFAAEIPEPIDYNTTTLKIGTEFGKKSWDAMLAYQTSLFHNNDASVLVNSPFVNFSDPAAFKNSTSGPAQARMGSYPDNKYQQFVTAGAVDITKYVRLMANVTPGIMTQTALFQPTTANTGFALTTGTVSSTDNAVILEEHAVGTSVPNMPQRSLDGRVNTLAMNYTAVFQPVKKLQLVAKYLHYDYNNNTPNLLMRVVTGDNSNSGGTGLQFANSAGCFSVGTTAVNTGGTPYCEAEQTSFNRKTFDLSGTYFITKKSSAKVGYQREWMDREHRQVDESIENTIYAATDLALRKDLMLRIAGRHQSRMPQAYDYTVDTINPGNPFMRYVDEVTRKRNRGDVSLQWNATDKLSISGFWGTLQDNFNLRDETNSLVDLGDLSHTPGLRAVANSPITAGTVTRAYGPYYHYGVLNNLATNFGVDADYAVTKNVVLFAEYVREYNRGRIMNGRNKGGLPYGAALNNNNLTSSCALNASGYWSSTSCDPINDVNMFTKDVINTYYGGTDLTLSKSVNVSVYYALSAAQSNINTDGVQCQVSGRAINGTAGYCYTNFANWALDDNTASAPPAQTFNYPEVVNRVHEVGAIAKFKLTKNIMPKFQYTFRKMTNVDWQTGVMNPFAYVGTALDPGSSTGTSTSTGMSKGLFLGADVPSYKAHIFSATVEYHF